ncbi:hypothetical protein EHQ76_09090 [Leptospira barantonii]|uniref:Uncharacterized protein n=1 Tax=Leptospira barantonii TaxID=2023184 RepID=A0A5F2BDY9_9LEPT|nr:hypothetical protein [Leptospira barantonii]TGM03789.1 hypothetical protein EHQ76_09090 [Leptospira barantonii]
MIEILELQTKHGKIKIKNDRSFQVDSADNLHVYDFIYNANNENYYASTQFGIFTTIAKAILLNNGGVSGLHEHCYVINDSKLLLCVGDAIFCLEIPSLKLLWISQVDTASCFGIYKISDGFIIHGECEITRINGNGNIIWQHSGSDIFTTAEGTDTFKIENDIIHAKSWDDRRYKFSLSGAILV